MGAALGDKTREATLYDKENHLMHDVIELIQDNLNTDKTSEAPLFPETVELMDKFNSLVERLAEHVQEYGEITDEIIVDMAEAVQKVEYSPKNVSALGLALKESFEKTGYRFIPDKNPLEGVRFDFVAMREEEGNKILTDIREATEKDIILDIKNTRHVVEKENLSKFKDLETRVNKHVVDHGVLADDKVFAIYKELQILRFAEGKEPFKTKFNRLVHPEKEARSLALAMARTLGKSRVPNKSAPIPQ